MRQSCGKARSAKPYRPSRRELRPTTGVLYLCKELVAARAGRAAHGDHMNPSGWRPSGHGRQSATAQKSWCADPHFFFRPTTGHPPGITVRNGASRRAHCGPRGPDTPPTLCSAITVTGKGLTYQISRIRQLIVLTPRLAPEVVSGQGEARARCHSAVS